MFYAHNHDDSSNLKGKDSIIKTSALIDEAIRLGAKGLAITNHETLSSSVKAVKYYNKLKKENKLPKDFKVGLGNEIYLIDRDYCNWARENNERINFFHLILIAKNKRGHEGLRELSSQAWLNRFVFRGYERVPTFKDDLQNLMKKYKGDIICSTACLGGELPFYFKKIRQSEIFEDKKKYFQRANEFIDFLIECFGKSDVYIELQPSHNEDQVEFNKCAYKFAKDKQLKPIITTDTHYLKKEHRIFHKYYLQSQDADREVDDFYATTYMMPVDEMYEYFKYWNNDIVNEMINNTDEIYSKIEMYDFYMEQQIPKCPIEKYELKHLFKDYYDKYEYLNKYANSPYEIDKFYVSLLEDGFIKKKQELCDKNVARINLEMRELWEISKKMNQHMSSYYVLTKDLIDIMWQTSIVGISRGSSSGYYTCYLLDIVQMNPLDFDLPHWRHLVAERPDMPDIDIDTQSSQRKPILENVKKKYEADGVKRVINCCTFSTEKARSSILTACRGLNIDSDIAQNIVNMIPNSSLTLTQCFYGDEEEGIKPVVGLIDELKKHDQLFEIVEMFEGLISGRSVHTSGVFIFNDGIIAQNAIMTSSSGTLVTQYNYDDAVYCGAMKLDFLSTAALEKIRSCMDLLIKNNKMQWQGTLRDTYNKYIHPDVLDFESEEMYQLLYHGDILDAFQFETVQGRNAIRLVQPHAFKPLMDSNSLMRLAGDTIERYNKFKNDINLWYTEMRQFGLTENEINVLRKNLDKSYGVAVTQEDVMILVMDKQIANFDIVLANKLRKAIAKADGGKLAKEVQVIYFEEGFKVGTSHKMLDYVWEKMIVPQLGYSFSMNHTCPYTGILIQEMNLAYRFGPIWWKTAVLCNNSGIINGEPTAGVGYGTIAKAINGMKDLIVPPDINKSDIGFTPDEENNKILFGLISIDGIGKNEVSSIIENRPYVSVDDFYERSGLTDKKKITIIKSGALDSFNPNRKQLLMDLVRKIVPASTSLNMQQYPKIRHAIPENLKVIDALWFEYKKAKTFTVKPEGIIMNDELINKTFISLDKEELFSILDFKDTEYWIYDSYYVVDSKLLEKKYNLAINPLKEWLSTPALLNEFNRSKLNNYWKENCLGTKESWEMETTVFYHDKHEFDYYDMSLFNPVDFNKLPEDIQFITIPGKGNRTRKAIKLNYICGTVIDKIKGKDRFVILTQYGPVTVKVTKNEYVFYDKKVVEIKGKEKRVLDDSWLNRGTKLIINGYRNKDYFKAKSNDDMPPIARVVGVAETKRPYFTINKLS